MPRLGSALPQIMLQSNYKQLVLRCATGLGLSASAVAVASIASLLHVNLSTAGSLEVLLVLLAALRFGFFQGTVVSIIAFLCLNFLFTAPVFTFVVADPQNWVSLLTFEATALLVSGLSTKVQSHAAEAEEQRARALKLYELSRAVLLIDQQQSTGVRLRSLIRELFEVDDVQVWVVYGATDTPEAAAMQANQQAYETYMQEKDHDDPIARTSHRVLRIGTNIVGGITLTGWKVDTLSADAIASIVAITLARTRAIQLESRAEMERDAERLRTAVLDGLAHGFKTPLTAISTASSGLLAIGDLSATQLELISIIDERATMLSQLTTRLLRTAALEAKEVRLRRQSTSLLDLLYKVVHQQELEVRNRIEIAIPDDLQNDELDAPMIELALQQLIDNAAKYSAVASQIPITIEQIPSQTVVVVQNVTIAGSSIRPEEKTRIFERFYRGIDAVYAPSGTGLGLSIVKKIAEAHGGGISVECNEATTRFALSIQRNEAQKNG